MAPSLVALATAIILIGLGFIHSLAGLADLPTFGLGLLLILGLAWYGNHSGWLPKVERRRVLGMGVPVVIAMLSQAMVNVVDTALVGMLPGDMGVSGVSALGISLPIFWLVGGALSAIGYGTQAIVARRFGGGEPLEAGRALMNSVALATTTGVFFSIVGYFALPSLLPLFNNNPHLLEQGIPFAKIRYIGIASMVVTAAYKAFFDGIGHTRVHMVAALVMNAVNLPLCWGLVFGEFGMPRLEVLGAAWASTLSSGIATLVMIGASLLPAIRDKFGLYQKNTLSWPHSWAIVRLSWPISGATVLGMLVFLAFHKAVATVDLTEPSGLPIAASAASVIQQILILIVLVGLAFGTSTAALVSQALGRNAGDDATRVVWTSVKLGVLLLAPAALLLFIYPGEVFGLFMHKNQALGEAGKTLAIASGVLPLQIISAASMGLAAGLIFTQALIGAGNTKFVLFAEGAIHITCLGPLAWLFGVVWGGGLAGIWAAAAVDGVLLATIMGWKIWEGRWRETKV